MLIFIALPLNLTARLLDEDDSWFTALGTTLLLIVTFFGCMYIIPWGIINLIVAIFVNLLIIKVIYDIFWDEAFVMWIVAIIMFFVILFVIVGIFMGIGAFLNLL
jgi:hypothetical protein